MKGQLPLISRSFAITSDQFQVITNIAASYDISKSKAMRLVLDAALAEEIQNLNQAKETPDSYETPETPETPETEVSDLVEESTVLQDVQLSFSN